MQLVLDGCVIFPTGRLAKDQQQKECTMIKQRSSKQKQQQVIAQKEKPRRGKGVLSVGDNASKNGEGQKNGALLAMAVVEG